MKALVVYESMYGNTAAIGEAIAASLRAEGLDVHAGPTSRIEPAEAEQVDVLLVGGPTHAHGLSTAATRRTAAADTKNTFAEPTLEPGLRGWIKRLPRGAGRAALAFDTRLDKPAVFTGSAAKGIARRLRSRGFRIPVAPECFLVSTENALCTGEVEHARVWAARVAREVEAGPGSSSELI